MAVNLFMSAFAAALGEAFVYLAQDPLLVWNYGVAGVMSFVGGVVFYIMYIPLDRAEDKLNNLPTGHLGTQAEADQIEAGRLASSSDESRRSEMEKV